MDVHEFMLNYGFPGLFIVGFIALIFAAIVDLTKAREFRAVCEEHNGTYFDTDKCMIREDGELVRYGIAKDTNCDLDIYRWAAKNG